jgi:XRE family transcriptional regulator, fatty acid utilization regulator
MSTPVIGLRIKALREGRKLSQEDLARLFGFKDRQTVSAIETGERRVTAEELLTAVEKLGAPLDYFTNPFLLVGEGRFSWRHSGGDLPRLEAFERSAGRWIAAYRTLAPQVGRPIPLLRRTLGIAPRQSFEDAAAAGERFAYEFKLGEVPAARLADIMERELGVLVLMFDAFEGVSGAACRLPTLDTVLINRHETAGRRHLHLAHELFHILTWDTMPPEHVEDPFKQSKNRVEQLASSFACALLMPTAALDRFGPWDGDLVARVNAAADELAVTPIALKSRLVATGSIDRAAAKNISDAALRNNDHPAGTREPLPPLFSTPFVEVIALAIEQGRVSARRAADLLDLTLEQLTEFCEAHEVPAPFNL